MQNSIIDLLLSMDTAINVFLIYCADNSCDCEAESNESYFKEGFKAGVRLAVECMCD